METRYFSSKSQNSFSLRQCSHSLPSNILKTDLLKHTIHFSTVNPPGLFVCGGFFWCVLLVVFFLRILLKGFTIISGNKQSLSTPMLLGVQSKYYEER